MLWYEHSSGEKVSKNWKFFIFLLWIAINLSVIKTTVFKLFSISNKINERITLNM